MVTWSTVKQTMCLHVYISILNNLTLPLLLPVPPAAGVAQRCGPANGRGSDACMHTYRYKENYTVYKLFLFLNFCDVNYYPPGHIESVSLQVVGLFLYWIARGRERILHVHA